MAFLIISVVKGKLNLTWTLELWLLLMHFIFFLTVCSLLIQHSYIHPTWLYENTISISLIVIPTLNNPVDICLVDIHTLVMFSTQIYHPITPAIKSHLHTFFKWNLAKIYHVSTNILFFSYVGLLTFSQIEPQLEVSDL